jgi:hypothetical protein
MRFFVSADFRFLQQNAKSSRAECGSNRACGSNSAG